MVVVYVNVVGRATYLTNLVEGVIGIWRDAVDISQSRGAILLRVYLSIRVIPCTIVSTNARTTPTMETILVLAVRAEVLAVCLALTAAFH